MKKFKDKTIKLSRNKGFYYIFIVALLMIAVVPQRHQLVQGVKTLSNANIYWILLAVFYLIITNIAAATVYMFLAKKTIKLWQATAVQFSASFANRLLPGGLGGLGLNVDFLLKSKHSGPEASAVVAMNSILAFVGHMILIFVAVVISNTSLSQLTTDRSVPPWLPFIMIFAILAILIFLWRYKKTRLKAIKLGKNTYTSLLAYKDHPLSLVLAMFSAMSMTVLHVFVLTSCAQAIGLHIGFVQGFAVYTLGVAVGAAVLTPGGLGGVEAGMVAGLVAINSESSLAISAIILYRFVTFWLLILPGYFTFLILRHKKVI